MIRYDDPVIIAAAAFILWNLICFSVTAFDKLAAKNNMRRVPEKTFLWFSALLGGAGVLLSFYLFRHKTRHYSLLAKTWLLTVISYAVTVGLYILYLNR
jgi:uncharacterized membrane protein YsdA (DUF1294 family)